VEFAVKTSIRDVLRREAVHRALLFAVRDVLRRKAVHRALLLAGREMAVGSHNPSCLTYAPSSSSPKICNYSAVARVEADFVHLGFLKPLVRHKKLLVAHHDPIISSTRQVDR